jgi:hypothetical protein
VTSLGGPDIESRVSLVKEAATAAQLRTSLGLSPAGDEPFL